MGVGTREPGETRADRSSPGQWPDWAWRHRVRGHRTLRPLYRAIVGVVGVLIVVAGVIMLPAPGPGWAVIFVGLAVLASEFAWAQRLLAFARAHVQRWTAWVLRQGWPVRAVVGLACLLLVLACFWAVFAVVGVPAMVPREWVPRLPGLR